MRWPRFSIAGMMGLLIVAGVGIAALRESTEGWAWLVLSLTLVTVAGAVAGAVARRGPRRAFWLAFGAVGGGYLAICFAPWCADTIKPRLPTSRLLDWLDPYLRPIRLEQTVLPRDRFDEAYSAWASTHPEPQYLQVAILDEDQSVSILSWVTPNRAPFKRIGHCLIGLFLAGLAGVVARGLAARRSTAQQGGP